jgi:lipid-binding SYLF domain-containing protein
MKLINRVWAVCAALSLCGGVVSIADAAHSDSRYHDTVTLFKNAGKSAKFFSESYAYAVFPTVGEGALVVGGARGKGHVYVHDKWTGNVTMNQVSVGLQAGGKAYSQIIFFKDERALQEFESGSFEFGADASAVAITASAEASAATDGQGSGVSGGMKDAVTHGQFYKGMAVFTIAKGGLMVQASVAGQKFSFTPRDAA